MEELEIDYSYNYDLKEEYEIPKIQPPIVVQFRPHRDYHGEFGFDWMRIGDTVIDGKDPFKDNPFENIAGISQDDNNSPVRIVEPNAYKNIKKTYSKLINIKNMEYFIPVLTLMNGYTAILDLYIEGKELPKDIILKIEGDSTKALSIDITNISGVIESKSKYQIKIMCNKEFDSECFLAVYPTDSSYNKNAICGKVRILPNSNKFQKKNSDILLVNVITSLNGKTNQAGDVINIRDNMKKFLRQAYIVPNIEVTDFLATDPRIFNGRTLYLNDKLRKMKTLLRARDEGISKSEDDKLNAQLDIADEVVINERKHLEIKRIICNNLPKKYDRFLKILLINERCHFPFKDSQEAALLPEINGGFASNDPTSFCCFRHGINASTVTHEFLHSLGLEHTFYMSGQFQQYIYKDYSTMNLMDYEEDPYNPVRNCLYYWQMKIANKKVK